MILISEEADNLLGFRQPLRTSTFPLNSDARAGRWVGRLLMGGTMVESQLEAGNAGYRKDDLEKEWKWTGKDSWLWRVSCLGDWWMAS